MDIIIIYIWVRRIFNISNKLNIVKFLPIQVKHIAYKNGNNKIEIIFNPFNSIEINKKEPVFFSSRSDA